MADGSFRHQLNDELVIKGESVRHAMTHRPDVTGAILLAEGQSPHRLEPSWGTWQPAQVVQHEFSVTAHPEFRLPRPGGD